MLVLDSGDYRLHGEFSRGTTATSLLLPDFSVEVNTAIAPTAFTAVERKIDG